MVLDAAAELVAENGVQKTSVEAISDRCGVARSTIYRHWPDSAELLVESVRRKVGDVEVPDTGDLRTDLQHVFQHLGRLLTSNETKGIVMSMAESTRDPRHEELHSRFTETRRKACASVIEAGIERGELPGDIDRDQMVTDIAAGIFFRALILHQPITDDWVVDHVDRWIDYYSSD